MSPSAQPGAKPRAGKPRSPRPAAPPKRNRRRRFLIDRRMQFGFAIVLLIQVVITAALFTLIVRLHGSKLSGMLKDMPMSNPDDGPRNELYLTRNRRYFYVGEVAMVVVGGLVLAGSSLRATHKLTGPVLRLKSHLAGHSFDATRPIRFRKGDRLEAVAEALNETATALERRRGEIAAALEALVENAQQLARADGPEAAFEGIETMEELVRQLTALMEAASA